MADISASMVMELRQRTGLGMMECKKALTEAGGDLAKAEELLRIKSGAKASQGRRPRRRRRRRSALYVAPDAQDRRDGRGELRDRLRREERRFPRVRRRGRADRRPRQPRRRRGARRAQARVRRDRRGAPRRRWCRRSARTCRSAASRVASPRASSRPTCTASKIGVLVDVDRRRRRARQGPRDAHRGAQAAGRVRQVGVSRRGRGREGARDRRGAGRRVGQAGRTSSRRWSKARVAKFLAEVTLLGAAVRQGRRQADGRAAAEGEGRDGERLHAVRRRRGHREEEGRLRGRSGGDGQGVTGG